MTNVDLSSLWDEETTYRKIMANQKVDTLQYRNWKAISGLCRTLVVPILFRYVDLHPFQYTTLYYFTQP